ncbi:MAG: hypothetical protein HYX56_00395 [Chloroflexi bacterium]|nr:hypothetical protein [Chloroflexota bacterium]
MPFTISKVSAEQVLKGSVPAGALLDVFETGGVMAPRPARGNAVQATRPLEYSFEGVPVVKPGERYLLFLTGPTSGAAASGVYTLVGEFQGKHLIDASGTIRFTGNAQELGGVEFATARATNGRPATDIIQEVQGSIR